MLIKRQLSNKTILALRARWLVESLVNLPVCDLVVFVSRRRLSMSKQASERVIVQGNIKVKANQIKLAQL